MRVVLRCDASASLGLGHLRRCLNLAQGLARGSALVAAHDLSAELQGLVRAAGVGVVELEAADDVPGLRAAARDHGADWLVIDSYAWTSSQLEACAGSDWRLCVLDDLAQRDLGMADLVVDPTPGPPRPGGLFGPRYALLHPTFPARRAASLQRSRTTRRGAVTLGGAPPPALIARVVAQLEGAGVDSLELLLGVFAGEALSPRPGRHLHGPLDPAGVADVLEGVDFAVAPPSTTAWELACLGVPTLLVQTADNQARNAAGLAALGVPVVEPDGVGDALARLDDLALRRRWVSVCDGGGVARVVATMRGSGERLVVLPSDGSREQAGWVHAWRNDPASRAGSTDPRPIPWEAHWAWFESVHADPQRLLQVGWFDGQPCGVVRFDAGAEDARVSLAVAPTHRGRGLAAQLLRTAELALPAWRLPVSRLRAEIRPDNVPSLRAFERAGYTRRPALEARDMTVWVRELTRSEVER